MQKVALPDGSVRNFLGRDDEAVYDRDTRVVVDGKAGVVVQANIDKTTGEEELRSRYYWIQFEGESEPRRVSHHDMPPTGLVQMSGRVKTIRGVDVPQDVRHFPMSDLKEV